MSRLPETALQSLTNAELVKEAEIYGTTALERELSKRLAGFLGDWPQRPTDYNRSNGNRSIGRTLAAAHGKTRGL